MPPVYINTDNNDKSKKIYIANLVGESASEAEEKMKTLVVKAIEKASEFTTNKIADPKGYTLSFKVTKFEAAEHQTSCTVTGIILRYPPITYSKSKESGASDSEIVMTAGNWSGSATATGKGRNAVMDCVEAIVEGMVPKSFPVMKADMTRR
jgi:hypothetical protein